MSRQLHITQHIQLTLFAQISAKPKLHICCERHLPCGGLGKYGVK